MAPKRAVRSKAKPILSAESSSTESQHSDYGTYNPPPAPRKKARTGAQKQALREQYQTGADPESDTDHEGSGSGSDDLIYDDPEFAGSGDEVVVHDAGAAKHGAKVSKDEDFPSRIFCAFRIPPPPKAGRSCKKLASRPVGGDPLLYCHLHWPRREGAGWPANPRKRGDLASHEKKLRKNDPNAPGYLKRGRSLGSENKTTKGKKAYCVRRD